MRLRTCALVGAMVAIAVAPAVAEEKAPGAVAPQAEEEAPADEAPEDEAADDEVPEALPPHKVGPMHVELGAGIQLDLPEGMILFEREEARRQLEERGDAFEDVLGIVTRPGADWELDIEMVDIGYVSDKDADKLDADDLLASMTQGNHEQNKIRKAKGIAPLEVVGWSKPPSYDRLRRVLSWSTNLSSEGEPFLNEDTNILGRRGYASAVLIASVEGIEAARADAAPAIAGISFGKGHTYEEFDPAVDKDSGIGLRELVAGGGAVAVASKLGLVGKIVLALKKFFVVIALAIAGLAKWLFGRRKKDAPAGE
jgi:uncharacterized membrane-anchored protein